MPSRLFIASIGNPGNLYNTLHSAGHTVLDSLHAAWGYPAFSQNISAVYDDPGRAPHALYRSPTFMNDSGGALLRAYRRWLKKLPVADADNTRLLILHDELEMQLGRVRFKSPGSSLKGHNGLRSIEHALGRRDFARIAVGIGRPQSRDAQAVIDYVLRETTALEKERMVARTRDVIDMIGTFANEAK